LVDFGVMIVFLSYLSSIGRPGLGYTTAALSPKLAYSKL